MVQPFTGRRLVARLPVFSEDAAVALALLRSAWADLGGDPELLSRVRTVGAAGLPSPLSVEALALGAVAAQRLAAQELIAADALVGEVVVDARHVGLAFRSERFLRIDGRPTPAGFAPLSRFWPSADGWVRLHANYPHHHRAALRSLGPDPAAAIAERTSIDIEDVVVAAGGVAAAVRAAAQWSAHPAGAAVANQPLLHLTQAADRAGNSTSRRRSAPQLPGLRVLDLTRVIAGPVGTRTLASYGADVLRVDSPSLPEDPTTLLETSPGKRCTSFDLTARTDRQRFTELLSAADVLVHGYRPGALERYGLTSDHLAEHHPGLVVVSLSAWGPKGPWSQRRGFDSIVQAATGIAAATAAPDGTPGVLPAQALDHGAGHLLAATVLRALTNAHQHGGTWHGHLSLAQLAHWLLTAPRQPNPAPRQDQDKDDPATYSAQLPSTAGTLTVITPPGSPPWHHGPVPVTPEEASWMSR